MFLFVVPPCAPRPMFSAFPAPIGQTADLNSPAQRAAIRARTERNGRMSAKQQAARRKMLANTASRREIASGWIAAQCPNRLNIMWKFPSPMFILHMWIEEQPILKILLLRYINW